MKLLIAITGIAGLALAGGGIWNLKRSEAGIRYHHNPFAIHESAYGKLLAELSQDTVDQVWHIGIEQVNPESHTHGDGDHDHSHGDHDHGHAAHDEHDHGDHSHAAHDDHDHGDHSHAAHDDHDHGDHSHAAHDDHDHGDHSHAAHDDHDHGDHSHAAHDDHDHGDHGHAAHDDHDHGDHSHAAHDDHDHGDHSHAAHDDHDHGDHSHAAHEDHDHGDHDHDVAHVHDEHGGHDLDIDLTEAITSAKDFLVDLKNARYERTNPKPISEAHRLQIAGEIEQMLLRSYKMDPTNYGVYNAYYLFLTSHELRSTPAAFDQARLISRTTIGRAQAEDTAPSAWLTAEMALLNLFLLDQADWRKKGIEPPLEALIAYRDQSAYCKQNYQVLKQRAIADGRWQTISSEKREEMETRERFAEKTFEQFDVMIARIEDGDSPLDLPISIGIDALSPSASPIVTSEGAETEDE